MLGTFLEILQDWQAAFPRQRSCRRAVAQALGSLTALGRCTLSRAIWALGHDRKIGAPTTSCMPARVGRTADLFQPVLARALPWCRGRYVAVAVDDTRLRKTGGVFKAPFTNTIRCLPSSVTT